MPRAIVKWIPAIAAVLSMSIGVEARAADIVLERSAVGKLLARTLYRDNGRYYLLRGTCYAYLDSPQVTLSDGRVRIRTHLSAALGQPVGNACVGQSFSPWLTVSGEPVARGGVVRLEKLQIERVSDPAVQVLLETVLGAALPLAIEIDVLKSVRDMLSSAGGDLKGTVERLDIASVTVAENRLFIRFDFRLIAE
jgi:hypothetical protein